MKQSESALIAEKLDVVIALLQQIVAMQMAEKGMSRSSIAKKLHLAKATVVDMLKGTKGGRET